MDTFARALDIADRISRDKALSAPLSERYAGYRHGMGRKIMTGQATLAQLESWASKQGEPEHRSGRQELLENVVNRYIFG